MSPNYDKINLSDEEWQLVKKVILSDRHYSSYSEIELRDITNKVLQYSQEHSSIPLSLNEPRHRAVHDHYAQWCYDGKLFKIFDTLKIKPVLSLPDLSPYPPPKSPILRLPRMEIVFIIAWGLGVALAILSILLNW